MAKILVCKKQSGNFFLRIHLNADEGGVLRFDSQEPLTENGARKL